jgi:hypothetical protein
MGNKKKTPNPHPWANPERNKAMLGLRSSNAAQPHVPGPRKGTRTERRQQAIQDQQKNPAYPADR